MDVINKKKYLAKVFALEHSQKCYSLLLTVFDGSIKLHELIAKLENCQ